METKELILVILLFKQLVLQIHYAFADGKIKCHHCAGTDPNCLHGLTLDPKYLIECHKEAEACNTLMYTFKYPVQTRIIRTCYMPSDETCMKCYNTNNGFSSCWTSSSDQNLVNADGHNIIGRTSRINEDKKSLDEKIACLNRIRKSWELPLLPSLDIPEDAKSRRYFYMISGTVYGNANSSSKLPTYDNKFPEEYPSPHESKECYVCTSISNDRCGSDPTSDSSNITKSYCGDYSLGCVSLQIHFHYSNEPSLYIRDCWYPGELKCIKGLKYNAALRSSSEDTTDDGKPSCRKDGMNGNGRHFDNENIAKWRGTRDFHKEDEEEFELFQNCRSIARTIAGGSLSDIIQESEFYGVTIGYEFCSRDKLCNTVRKDDWYVPIPPSTTTTERPTTPQPVNITKRLKVPVFVQEPPDPWDEDLDDKDCVVDDKPNHSTAIIPAWWESCLLIVAWYL